MWLQIPLCARDSRCAQGTIARSPDTTRTKMAGGAECLIRPSTDSDGGIDLRCQLAGTVGIDFN